MWAKKCYDFSKRCYTKNFRKQNRCRFSLKICIMKKIMLITIASLISWVTFSQSLLGGKNIIKTNLSGIALGNYHVTYERAVFKNMSLSVSYRYMPKRLVPLKSTLDKYITSEDVFFGDFQMGNTAITPEFRFYFGLGKMKGFYVAPYGRFAKFDLSVPVKYVASSLPGSPTKYATFSGTINSFSGGLMIGTQFQIFKKLVLDIWMLGAHYGNSTGQLDATNITPAMTSLEQQSLQATLNDLKEIGPFKFEGKVVNSTTAYAKSVGPWAGIRGLGINLGIRF